jgi:hypothetical protein
MLICSVSQLSRRAAVAADIAEAAVALDSPGTGNVVFATLVDDPASVAEIVDGYLGQIMLEAASANDIFDGALAGIVAAAIVEAALAADTPDGAAVPAGDANAKLLLGFNDSNGSTGAPGMTDESIAAHGTATASTGAQISTAQFKFGTSSLSVNGSNNSCITFPDSADWDFGLNPFTIEGFFRFAAAPTNALLVGQWPGGWAFWFESGRIYLRPGLTTDAVLYTWTPTLNQWYHIDVDRDAALNARLYVDGAMVAKTTGWNANLTGSSSVLMIGSLSPGGFGGFNLNGYVDELRISNVARYGSDAGFTVPTSPFPR